MLKLKEGVYMRLKTMLALPLIGISLLLTGCDDVSSLSDHEHTYSQSWSTDVGAHWHAATCEHGNQMRDVAEHVFGNDNVCDVCKYEKYVPSRLNY